MKEERKKERKREREREKERRKERERERERDLPPVPVQFRAHDGIIQGLFPPGARRGEGWGDIDGEKAQKRKKDTHAHLSSLALAADLLLYTT